MSVDYTLPEYNRAVKKWELVRSIIDNDATHLIPDVDINDQDRSIKYRNNAILTNFTGLTKNGLQGLVFLKDPDVELPPQLEYMREDATGSGLSMTQLAQQVCGEVLETGRHGLLVDFPRNENTLSISDLETGNYVARILPYTAEAIINWRTERVNGKVQLVQIVLKECKEVVLEDGFETEKLNQYRVLKLVNGQYYQELYNEDQDLVDVVQPLKVDGTPLTYIPFVFVGSENNDPVIDPAPLYDLAVLNLGHYKNSADFEESVFICGQPTVVVCVGDIPADQWVELNGGKFRYGARSGHVVGLGGNASLLQANPNQLAGQAMKDKLDQAVGVGARVIAAAGAGRETAEGARIRYSGQNSALYVVTKNMNRAFIEIIRMACDFTKDADKSEVSFELNDQFYEDGADPQLIAQAIMMVDRQAMTVQELRNYVASTGEGLITEPELQVEIDAVQNDPTE